MIGLKLFEQVNQLAETRRIYTTLFFIYWFATLDPVSKIDERKKNQGEWESGCCVILSKKLYIVLKEQNSKLISDRE